MAIKRVLVTVMTLGVGGSGGIEGPAIPVGQHIGSGFAKLYKVKIFFGCVSLKCVASQQQLQHCFMHR